MSDKNNARWVQKKTGCKYQTALHKVCEIREAGGIVEYINKVRALPNLPEGATRCMHCLETVCTCAKSTQ